VITDDNKLLEAVANAQRERSRTFNEMAQNSLFFFCEIEAYDEKAARKNLTPDAAPVLQALAVGFRDLAQWNAGSIHEVINAVAERHGVGLGKVAQPLRVAVSGGAISPPIDITVALLGRDKTCARIERALRWTPSL
jgi:glutamyl-tRNA synthetase